MFARVFIQLLNVAVGHFELFPSPSTSYSLYILNRTNPCSLILE